MPAPIRAGARQWAALAVLIMPVLIVSIDTTALSFAVPQLSAGLRPTSVQLLWIVDVYPLALAGLLVTMGVLGDRVGRRKLLFIGTAGFALVSIYAAYAPDAGHLIAARALLGVFGATLLPSTMSLIRNIFLDDEQRRLAIAVWSAGFAGGGALGPIVGGWLLEHMWWGSIFLLAVPIIAVFLVLAPFVVPESRRPDAGSLDPLSVALSIGTMGPIAFGVKHGAQSGIDTVTFATIVLGLACGTLFVRRQLRSEHPLLDVRLFGRRVFTASILANFATIFVFNGVTFYLSQHMQLVQGLSPLEAGLRLLPGAAASILMGVAVVYVARAVPRWVLIGFGMSIVAAGAAAGITIGVATPLLVPVAIYVLLGLGSAMAQTLTNDAIVSSVPAERAGAASGISETAYELGTSLGVAVLGSLLTVTYTRGLVVPDGVPASEEFAVRQTLGAAEAVVRRLPAEVGAALHEAATLAFVHAVNVTSFVAAGALLVVAALLTRTLKRAGLGRA